MIPPRYKYNGGKIPKKMGHKNDDRLPLEFETLQARLRTFKKISETQIFNTLKIIFWTFRIKNDLLSFI